MSFNFSQDENSRQQCSSLCSCNRADVYNSSIADMMVEAKALRQAGRTFSPQLSNSLSSCWKNPCFFSCEFGIVFKASELVRLKLKWVKQVVDQCSRAGLVKVRRVVHLIQTWWCLSFWWKPQWPFTKQSVTALITISLYSVGFHTLLLLDFKAWSQHLAYWLNSVSIKLRNPSVPS